MPAEPVTPAASYISAALPPGSIDHYVVLMTAAEHRPLTETALALGKVISNIACQPGEPQIRQLKLHWFLQEVERIDDGAPRHPLTTELHRLSTHQSWLEALRGLIEAMLVAAEQSSPATVADLLAATHRAAERQALLASVMPHASDTGVAAARNIGTGIAITEHLRDGCWQWPAEECGVVSRAAHEHFEAADVRHAAAALPVFLQGRLYRRLLLRLEQNGFDSDQAGLTPLGLLWHAWREARKLLRP